jgi:hypothetical protein
VAQIWKEEMLKKFYFEENEISETLKKKSKKIIFFRKVEKLGAGSFRRTLIKEILILIFLPEIFLDYYLKC